MVGNLLSLLNDITKCKNLNMKRFFIAITFFFIAITSKGQSISLPSSAITKFSQTLYYIHNYYLDTVNFSEITDKAIIATIRELDPHSSFISAKDVKAMNEPLQGEFEGIGIEFAIINDSLTVQAPVAGGPSERVGLLAGDKIISVDSVSIVGKSITNDMVFKCLRGKKGTKVNLVVLRKGESTPLHFTIVRDKIPLFSVDASYFVKKGYFYIKLSRFAASSHEEIVKAINEKGDEVKALILDLRGNSGGYLVSAIDIANEFLSKGELIVYTEGRKVPKIQERGDGNGIFKSRPIVVLIDENSASASEILAGAIQDQDRGVIIGRRSFGKGLVQQALPLTDGSQLRLTIARYHTPSGRVIQSPYENGNIEEYYQNFYKRYANGETFSKDSINFPDSLKYKTLKKERIVFGGGGIMPDYFIPQDTTGYSVYYSNLIRKGVVIEYMNKQGDINRGQWIKKYPTFEDFEKKFVVTDSFFNGLIDFAKDKGIQPDNDQIQTSKKEIILYMRALAASSIYSRDSFYRIVNSNSHEIVKAIEVIDNWEK